MGSTGDVVILIYNLDCKESGSVLNFMYLKLGELIYYQRSLYMLLREYNLRCLAKLKSFQL